MASAAVQIPSAAEASRNWARSCIDRDRTLAEGAVRHLAALPSSSPLFASSHLRGQEEASKTRLSRRNRFVAEEALNFADDEADLGSCRGLNVQVQGNVGNCGRSGSSLEGSKAFEEDERGTLEEGDFGAFQGTVERLVGEILLVCLKLDRIHSIQSTSFLLTFATSKPQVETLAA